MKSKLIQTLGVSLFIGFIAAGFFSNPQFVNPVEAIEFSPHIYQQNLDQYNRFQTPSLSYYNMLVQGVPTKFVNMEHFFTTFTTDNQQTNSQDNYHYSTNEGLSMITQQFLDSQQYIYEGGGFKVRLNPPPIYFYSLGQNSIQRAYAYEDELSVLNSNLKSRLNQNYFTPALHRSVFTNASNLPINEKLYYSYTDQFDLSQYQNLYFRLERYTDGESEPPLLIVQKQITLSENSLLDLESVQDGLSDFFNKTYRITIASTENAIETSQNRYDIYFIEPNKTRNFFTYFNRKEDNPGQENDFDDTQEIDDEETIYFYNESGKIVTNTIIPNLIWSIDNGVTFNQLSQGSNQITPENGEKNFRIAYFDPVTFAIEYFRFTSKSTMIPEVGFEEKITMVPKEFERVCELEIGDFSFLSQYAFVVNTLQIRYSQDVSSQEQILNLDDSPEERKSINPNQLKYMFSRAGYYKVLIAYNGSPIKVFNRTCSFPELRAEFKENDFIDITTNINSNPSSNFFTTNQRITFHHRYEGNRMLTSISEQKMKEKNQFQYELEADGNQTLIVALSNQKTHIIDPTNSQNSIKKYIVKIQDSQDSRTFKEWTFLMDTAKPRLQYAVVDDYKLTINEDTINNLYQLDILEFTRTEQNGKTTRISNNQIEGTNIVSIKHEPIYILYCNPNEYKSLNIQTRFFSPYETVSGKEQVIPPYIINQAEIQSEGNIKPILIDQKLKYTPCSETSPFYIIDFSNENGQKNIEIELIDLANNSSRYRLEKQVKLLSTPNLMSHLIGIFVISLVFFFLPLVSFPFHSFTKKTVKS